MNDAALNALAHAAATKSSLSHSTNNNNTHNIEMRLDLSGIWKRVKVENYDALLSVQGKYFFSCDVIYNLF